MPIDASARVVIVGASAGGLTAAEALRHEGFEGPITLVGDEARLPYRRPPLSKQVLTGEWPGERAHLLDAGGLDDLDLRLMLGSRASELDVAAHTLVVDGDLVPYDTLVVATGVKARQLPGVGDVPGIHTLRTLDDVDAIRAGLETRLESRWSAPACWGPRSPRRPVTSVSGSSSSAGPGPCASARSATTCLT